MPRKKAEQSQSQKTEDEGIGGKGRNWRENPENPKASQVLGLAEIILWK